MLSFQEFGPASTAKQSKQSKSSNRAKSSKVPKKSSSSPTLVLLHGWGGEWRSWFPIIERFKKTHHLLVPDLPGFGSSSLPRALELEDYATEVLQWIHAQKLSQVVLVGHSFGGAIATLIAVNEPSLVKQLVLVDASGIRPKSGARKRAMAAIASTGRKMFELPMLSRAFPMLRKALYSLGPLKGSDYAILSDKEWRQTFRNIVSRDISNDLVRVSCPTLLVWGSEDKDAPLWQGERMHELIPHSNLLVFMNAGHFPYLDQTDRFEEAVREFLK